MPRSTTLDRVELGVCKINSESKNNEGGVSSGVTGCELPLPAVLTVIAVFERSGVFPVIGSGLEALVW